jgi:UDP-N-acetylmuramate--alanine ligase
VAVSGSDAGSAGVLSGLAELGADVHAGHSAGHLGDADTVVVSSAIRDANPELAEARRRGLRILPRAAALASIMSGRRATAVAGTHGKTTTTSMLTTILRQCGAGIVVSSFLMLTPYAAVITNVEADHLDNYAGLDEIRSAFEAFARRVSPGGILVACADDPGARALAEACRDRPIRIRSYGEAATADYRVGDVTPRGMGSTFRIAGTSASSGPFDELVTILVPGRHNALNAAAAFAVAAELGVPARQAAAALSAYRGAQRRMEPKGAGDGVRVLDSYAHHPTEVAADLAAARDLAEGGRVIAIFQPHLFSRTRIFAAELGAALGRADEAVILDIYAAREDPEPGVTGRLVADAVPGARARYVPEAAHVPQVIADIAKPGDVVLTMGAGDVTRLGPEIVAALRARGATPGPPEAGG